MGNLFRSLFLFSGSLNRITFFIAFGTLFWISNYDPFVEFMKPYELPMKLGRLYILFSMMTSRLRDAGGDIKIWTPFAMPFLLWYVVWISILRGPKGDQAYKKEKALENSDPANQPESQTPFKAEFSKPTDRFRRE